MSDEQLKEVKWSCGCHEVDGKLAVKCSTTQLQGEVSASRHAQTGPVSQKCFRLAAQQQAEEAAAKAKAAADAKAAAEEALKAAPAQDIETGQVVSEGHFTDTDGEKIHVVGSDKPE